MNLEPKEATHKTDLLTIKNVNELLEDIKKIINNNGDYQKIEQYASQILEKCSEYFDVKKIYIEAMLINNKPSDVLAFIREKITDEEKKLGDVDYYQAKAWYFLAN